MPLTIIRPNRYHSNTFLNFTEIMSPQRLATNLVLASSKWKAHPTVFRSPELINCSSNLPFPVKIYGMKG